MRRAASIVPLIVVLIGMLVLGEQWTIAAGVPLHACETVEPARVSEVVLSSYPFENIFRLDLLTIASSILEIVEIRVHDYLDMRPIALWANIRITYTSGLSDIEKVALQYDVEDALNTKWYIDFVEPNYYVGIPENPPPPWPGFAIGQLNVRFMDSSIAQNIVHNIDSDISYETIQAAINANETLSGHTIYVSPGTYYETIVVSKSVSLIGEARESAIIDANGTGTAVTVIANDTRIIEFTIQNGGKGIEVENASRVELSQNDLLSNGEGINVLSSEGVTITDNVVIGYATLIGVALRASSRCLISHNEISDYWPLNLVGSDHNTISDNFLFAKGTYGIYMTFTGTYDNRIFGNSIFDASWAGIRIRYGCSNNLIFHNNFLNNTVQAECSIGCVNVWDNGCEGNYWSDYVGPDSDGDGIGDVPYMIVENNTDPYPLMNPYWNIGDINHDLTVDIFDVVECANAYGSTPSSPNWDPHCDIASPKGIINIFDVVTLAASYGEEYTS